jgi:NTE family protein
VKPGLTCPGAPGFVDLVAYEERDRGELARLIGTVPLFTSLAAEDRDDLARSGDIVEIEPDDLLFRQGEPADAMYVVLSGRLEALVAVGASERVIRAFKRGEVIGELGLLAETERSASIRAIRRSQLLRIDADDFARLVDHSPAFGRDLSRSLALRLQQSGPSLSAAPQPPRTIAVVFLHDGLARILPPETLAESLRRWGSLGVMSSPETRSAVARAETLRDLENRFDRVLLVAVGIDADSSWTSFCVHEADALVVVASASTPLPDPHEARPLLGCHLILVGGEALAETAPWLDRLRARGHTLAEAPDGEAVERMVRRTIGKSVGLVLSGGGARGLAHIGVLEVLCESGILIDRVGGCSMGAFVAALFAMGMSPAAIHGVSREELVRRKPFADYTIPRVSLIRAVRAEEMLRRIFRELSIEQLPRDFFCVSADLLTAELVVHRRGSVVRAVGASMSLPGLAPPVVDGERLLVDGGVLDNLPIDVMAAADEGPIIAVDVMRKIGREGQVARDRKRPALPTIVETLSRATALGSWHLAGRNQARAALVITPDLPSVGTFDWRQIDAVVEAGRDAARRALEGGRVRLGD